MDRDERDRRFFLCRPYAAATARAMHRGGFCRAWGEERDAVQEAMLTTLRVVMLADAADPERLKRYVGACVRNRLRDLAGRRRPASGVAAAEPGREGDQEMHLAGGQLRENLRLMRADGRELLLRRFGVGREAETLRRLAAREGVSREAIRVREGKALAALSRLMGGLENPGRAA